MNSSLPEYPCLSEEASQMDDPCEFESFDQDGKGSGEYIYLIEANLGDIYKIGITSDPERRMRELRPRAVLALAEVANARFIEKTLHAEYAFARLAGTEYFSLAEDDIHKIILTIETDSGNADPSYRLVPATVKEGIQFAIEYQNRHVKFMHLSYQEAFHKLHRDLDPVKMAELELKACEAFDQFFEYTDACGSFRGYAYSYSTEGVLKAVELICAYHAYRIEQGEDEAGEDLEPRRWMDDLLQVREWKKAGMAPRDMMHRFHEIASKRTQEVLDDARQKLGDSGIYTQQASGNSLGTQRASGTTPPIHDHTLKSTEHQGGNPVPVRRARALARWRSKKSGDSSTF